MKGFGYRVVQPGLGGGMGEECNFLDEVGVSVPLLTIAADCPHTHTPGKHVQATFGPVLPGGSRCLSHWEVLPCRACGAPAARLWNESASTMDVPCFAH